MVFNRAFPNISNGTTEQSIDLRNFFFLGGGGEGGSNENLSKDMYKHLKGCERGIFSIVRYMKGVPFLLRMV